MKRDVTPATPGIAARYLRTMRRFVLPLALVLLAALAVVGPAAAAAKRGWSAVPLPPKQAPQALACTSTRWCEAVGAWRGTLTAAHWGGRMWKPRPAPPLPPGAVTAALHAVTCRSPRSCVAVGEWAGRQLSPVRPLVERWGGRRWTVERAPSGPRFDGFRYTDTRLYGVACPESRLCFAVGQEVAFGAGGTPGAPIIEQWDGRHWHVTESPDGIAGPLRSISCTSARACTAVGDAGVIERWEDSEWTQRPIFAPSGSAWVAAPQAPPPGDRGARLLGVSCTSTLTCDAVGTAGPSLAASWDSSTWTATALAGAARGRLQAIACQTSISCVAVGRWTAASGGSGPLGAVWDGAMWRQTVLHRGLTQLQSVSCPASRWCMAVGSGIAERHVG
jgi:hypothetical protein